jgi:pimeloyl-ACP methyl ester carboxylesterase
LSIEREEREVRSEKSPPGPDKPVDDDPRCTAGDSQLARTILAPPRNGLFRELRGLLELPRLLLAIPSLAREPRGNGEPVLVLPGYGAGDVSTIPLQTYLRCLGYRVRGLGSGSRSADVPQLLLRAVKRLGSLARRAGRRVHLVGWSLGGFLAREAARERPELVSQIITLGTPVVGGPKYTALARAFERRGLDIDAIAARIDERNRLPLAVPVTAIYSRNDAVVAWRACIDTRCLQVEHIEVRTTHIGLGLSPEVYRIIARRLASPLGPA